MTPPSLALERLIRAVVLGLPLGLYYSFLRPLRRGRCILADLLLLPVCFWVWLIHSFAICQGDLRLGYFVPYFGGCLLWEATLGRWLRPLFFTFWMTTGWFFTILLWPLKKFFHFAKRIR